MIESIHQRSLSTLILDIHRSAGTQQQTDNVQCICLASSGVVKRSLARASASRIHCIGIGATIQQEFDYVGLSAIGCCLQSEVPPPFIFGVYSHVEKLFH